MKRVALAFWVIIAAIAAFLSLAVLGFAYLDLLLALVTLGVALEVLLMEVHHQKLKGEWGKVRTDVALISQWMEETHLASQDSKDIADTRLVRLDARRAALERKVMGELKTAKQKLRATEQKLLTLTRKVTPHLRHKIVRVRESAAKTPTVSVSVASPKTESRKPKTVTITRPRSAKATVEVKVGSKPKKKTVTITRQKSTAAKTTVEVNVKSAKSRRPKKGAKTTVNINVEPKTEQKPVRVGRTVIVSVPEDSDKKKGVTVTGRNMQVNVGRKRKRTKVTVRA